MVRSFAAVALLAALLVGCGKAPVGNGVSGKVTFKGNPIPAGTIYFEPDVGAAGSQGVAKIVDGAYDTRSTGMGVAAGKTRVRIEGFEKGASSDAMGPILCRWETTAEFKDGDNVQDFEVPESAAVTATPDP